MTAHRTATIALVTVALLLALTASASAQTFASAPATAIPDSPAEGIQDTIFVSGGPTSLGSLMITINIDHTWDSDLAVWLVPPAVNWPGAFTSASESDAVVAGAIQLVNRIGGSGANFTDTSFTGPGDDFDPGTSLVPNDSVQAPFTGMYYPADIGWFMNLYGSDANGSWKLVVYDNAGGDTGTLNAWSMQMANDPNAVPAGGNPAPTPNAEPKDTRIGFNSVDTTGGCNACIGAGDPTMLLGLLLAIFSLVAIRRANS